MTELPKIIPLFPLPNLVLFPGMKVPLHIFEPRYRLMIADALRGDRIIGMMLLKDEVESDNQTYPDVFKVGCAGRIGEIERLADGRFNLVLEGLSEFRIAREIRDLPYRQAEVEWCPVPSGALDCDFETMESLREVLIRYLGEPARDAWRTVVDERGLRHEALINFLCFHLDVSPIEKQTVLEAREGRVDCLLDVLSFRLEERKLAPGGPGNGQERVQ